MVINWKKNSISLSHFCDRGSRKNCFNFKIKISAGENVLNCKYPIVTTGVKVWLLGELELEAKRLADIVNSLNLSQWQCVDSFYNQTFNKTSKIRITCVLCTNYVCTAPQMTNVHKIPINLWKFQKKKIKAERLGV